jgi:hypothetical protein
MVVGEITGQDATEVSLAEDEHVIQALAPDRADEPLHERVLPRALRRGENLLDPRALQAMPKWLTVDAVAVAEEVGRRGLVREGVDELLSGPDGGRRRSRWSRTVIIELGLSPDQSRRINYLTDRTEFWRRTGDHDGPIPVITMPIWVITIHRSW